MVGARDRFEAEGLERRDLLAEGVDAQNGDGRARDEQGDDSESPSRRQISNLQTGLLVR
jgi:hypothetical protein